MGKKPSNRDKGKKTGERKDRNNNTLLFIIFSAVIIICFLAIAKLFLFKIKNSDERQNKITTEIKIKLDAAKTMADDLVKISNAQIT